MSRDSIGFCKSRDGVRLAYAVRAHRAGIGLTVRS